MIEEFHFDVSAASSLIEKELQQFLKEQESHQSEMRLYRDVYEDMREYLLRKGKRIRPMLFLVAYRAFGGEKSIDFRPLLRSAISLELLHGFILIHDDIIDLSDTRRGLPTLHRKVERHFHRTQDRSRMAQGLAMVAGDILFSMASEAIQQSDLSSRHQYLAVRYFQRYVTETGIGEIYDILLGSRPLSQTSREDILQMYTLKTTRYTFEAPFVLGALYAGIAEEKITEISKICEPLGLAFQMMNDLDEFQSEEVFQSDLMDAKKTLLLFETYQGLHAKDRAFLDWCVERIQEPNSLRKIKALVHDSKAVERLQSQMKALFDESQTRLRQSSLSPEQQKGLESAIHWVRETAASTRHTHA